MQNEYEIQIFHGSGEFKNEILAKIKEAIPGIIIIKTFDPEIEDGMAWIDLYINDLFHSTKHMATNWNGYAMKLIKWIKSASPAVMKLVDRNKLMDTLGIKQAFLSVMRRFQGFPSCYKVKGEMKWLISVEEIMQWERSRLNKKYPWLNVESIAFNTEGKEDIETILTDRLNRRDR